MSNSHISGQGCLDLLGEWPAENAGEGYELKIQHPYDACLWKQLKYTFLFSLMEPHSATLNYASMVDFTEASPMLERTDGRVLKEAILTEKEARRRGIGKSTLHYLQKNARAEQPFKTYKSVRTKLDLSSC